MTDGRGVNPSLVSMGGGTGEGTGVQRVQRSRETAPWRIPGPHCSTQRAMPSEGLPGRWVPELRFHCSLHPVLHRPGDFCHCWLHHLFSRCTLPCAWDVTHFIRLQRRDLAVSAPTPAYSFCSRGRLPAGPKAQPPPTCAAPCKSPDLVLGSSNSQSCLIDWLNDSLRL